MTSVFFPFFNRTCHTSKLQREIRHYQYSSARKRCCPEIKCQSTLCMWQWSWCLHHWPVQHKWNCPAAHRQPFRHAGRADAWSDRILLPANARVWYRYSGSCHALCKRADAQGWLHCFSWSDHCIFHVTIAKKAATSGSLFISNQSVFTFNLVFIDQPFHPIFNDGIICVGYNFLCIGRIIRDDSIHIQ